MKKTLYLVIFLTVFALAFFITYNYKENNKYNFKANSINGKVSLKSFKNKYKIIYFGYTFCPDICPITLALAGTILDEINAKDVVVLFVTLDPLRDELKATDEYAKYFYKNSYGLKLNENELQKMAKNYGVKYEKVALEDSAMGYSVAHSSSLYLFDKNDNLVQEVSNLTYEEVKSSLINLLKINP